MRSSVPASTSSDKLAKLTWPAIRRLIALAAPYKLPLGLASGLMIVATGISLYYPLLGRQAINNVTATKDVSSLDRYVYLFLGLILLSATIGFVQHMLASYAGNQIVMNLRLRLFDHLQRLPVTFFDKTRSGDLASHLSNDVSQLQGTLTDDVVKLASNALTLFGGIFIALSVDWRLTLVVVTLLFTVMLFFVVFGRRLRKLNRDALDALSDAMGAITEALANIRLVKAFTREPFENERAAGKLDKLFKLQMKSEVSTATMGAVASAGFAGVMLGVIWYGGRRVMDGSLQIGDLVAFFMTVMIIAGPMGSLASLYTRLQRSVGASDRIFALLDEGSEPEDGADAQPFPEGAGQVEFRSIQFAYNPESPVLTDLSLILPAGKVTALVGPSGSGKTTVSALLYRFYDPQAGQILIDGVPLSKIRREDLRAHIGIVPQEPILFNGTLRENIRYGRLDATDAEVEEAARSANVAEFASGMPEKYETMIGERGVTLSGGQRQRVAIARALLKNPRILILDEATSALDNKSEALVVEALDRLMSGRTTLVIAHRLTTVQRADQIAVLTEGRVIETGTHLDLLRTGGRYAELYELTA